MRTVTASQMKVLDQKTIEHFGVPAVCLMENAGKASADEAEAMLRRTGNKKILILCGAGNNGGDGFVAARHLWNKGFRLDILFVGDEKRMKEPAAINFAVLRHLKIRVLSPSARVLATLNRYGLIIDAFYGIGLNWDLEGLCHQAITAVNASGVSVLALDIPSGLNATTGQVHGVCIKAKRTVTFAVAKKGLVLNEGPRYAGRVIVRDIGIIS